MQKSIFRRNQFIFSLIAFAVLINFSGLYITIMDPDATRYATIAKTMVLKNDFVNLYCDGTDWLDKPHFPFWITAIFFKIFGFTTWAYKLPGILFTLLGVLYTYLFAKKLYNKNIALLAALILLTALHIILSDNDVRAEPFLLGLIIGSVYHFYLAYKQRSFWNLITAAFFAACAIMTKGVFAIIPIAGAIGGELLIQKDWKNFFHYRWLLAGVLILIFIFPELYSLYRQFDLHPDKIIFGRTHVSGIKFFFWDSQFGRFVNTGPIKGHGDYFYFFHTLLWAFLPWSLLLYAAIVATIRNNWRKPASQEWYCICGALLTFVIFSLSRFQLSYYLNIVFSFFAIIAAQYFYKLKTHKTITVIKWIQSSIVILLLTAPWFIQFFFKADYFQKILPALLLILLLLVFASVSKKILLREKIILTSALSVFFLWLYLNFCFYPTLLKYQSGSEAAFWINKNNQDHLPVYTFQHNYDFEFYLNQPVHYLDTGKNILPACFIYAKNDQLDALAGKSLPLQWVKKLEHYPVSRLTIKFINTTTRKNALEKAGIFLYHSK